MAPHVGITGRTSAAQQARHCRHDGSASRKSLNSGGKSQMVVRLRLGVGNRGLRDDGTVELIRPSGLHEAGLPLGAWKRMATRRRRSRRR
jgi:hypothetical protein